MDVAVDFRIPQASSAEKLEMVIRRAARPDMLPAEVGAVLLTMIEPEALATMAAALTIWAGSHFFGVGEIADLVLLIVGFAALGAVAWEAGGELVKFGKLTLNAGSEAEIDAAARHLAKAISLLGVQTVMALLLRSKPGATLKTPYSKMSLPRYSQAFPRPLPRSPGPFYRPKVTITRRRLAGEGGTNAVGDITLGRDFVGSAASAAEQLRLAAYHETIHRVLAPKLQIFREFRVYLKRSGYMRSYILRYLEESLAETYAQLRVNGLGKEYILKGLAFPLGKQYEITVSLLGQEAKGFILGPIIVGGMVYNVYEGVRSHIYD